MHKVTESICSCQTFFTKFALGKRSIQLLQDWCVVHSLAALLKHHIHENYMFIPV